MIARCRWCGCWTTAGVWCKVCRLVADVALRPAPVPVQPVNPPGSTRPAE